MLFVARRPARAQPCRRPLYRARLPNAHFPVVMPTRPQSATENLPPQVMSRLGKELKKLVRTPPDGIKFIPNEEERMDEIHAEIAGPGA